MSWIVTRNKLPMPIQTQRLTLRALKRDDFGDVYALCADPDICRYIRPPMTREQVATHIAERARPWRLMEGAWDSLAVCRRDEARVIGEAVFRIESAADRRAEIGFRFHPDGQGKGYAFEAMQALVAVLFGPAGLHKLTAYCHSENAASQRLLTRLGFCLEGRWRAHFWLDGGWRDLCLYGRINPGERD